MANTKRALLTSALAIVACVAMLIGSTFAWFTDTAGTAVNKIQAGNLDVKLEYKNADTTDFTEAKADTPVFKEGALWEPGHVEYVVLKVSNVGSLALKYKLGINIANETGSTNVDGNAFKLSDYIKFAVVDGDQSSLGRDALVTKAGEGAVLNAGYTKEDHLNKKGDANIVTLVVWMPTAVGNEANHKTDAAAPSIDLGINVYATQYTYESDSFNDQYDKDAKYTEVIAAGKTFTGKATLSTGITATDPNAIAVKAIGADADVTILDGTFDGGSGGNNQCIHVRDGATVTIKGGTFTVGGDANGEGNSVIESNGGNIIIEGGFFQTDHHWRGFYYVLNQQNNNPGTITVKGGTFVNYDPSKGDDNLGGSFVADGYTVVTETHGEDTWYTVVKDPKATTYPEGKTEANFGEADKAMDAAGNTYTSFKEALENVADGGTLYFKKDSTVDFPTHLNVTKSVTIYGNGADFSGKDISIGTYAAPESSEVTVNIYNTKNLVVWGQPIGDRADVWNVNFYGCENNGYNFLMYRGGENGTAKINLTMTDCKATGFVDSIVHTTADGTITIKNCTFANNCAPINIAHKQAGSMTVTVEDCTFTKCGKVDTANDYFAPARFVNNSAVGTLTVSLKNNTFKDTIGTNGDILLGDYRTGKASHALTATIVTETPVMVKSSADAAYSYNGGTITLE